MLSVLSLVINPARRSPPSLRVMEDMEEFILYGIVSSVSVGNTPKADKAKTSSEVISGRYCLWRRG
jgi:hypothetical protein